MHIIDKLKNETDIETLREMALKYFNLLYMQTKKYIYKFEIEEFILGSLDLSVKFEYYENPKISIVIPAKNEFIMTAALLNSIKRNTQGIEYEVIIADDNSEDEIKYIDKIFPNLRRINNDSGHDGFIYNVNNAISKARGEYIFLMNNDMVTMPQYLEKLLEVIEFDKTIGIAGSKILNIDYTVQQLGVTFNSNAEVTFEGAGEHIDYMDNVKCIKVDYCSGCAILFRHDIFDKAGGFDINFAPAYFDDSDFAFKLNYDFDLISVCVPSSKIFHFGSISYGENKELSSFVEKNRKYFLKKWGKYLED